MTELLALAALLAASLFTVALAVFIALLVADLRAWLLKGCRRLVSVAAHLCPEPHRFRYSEEWQRIVIDLEDAPLTMLAFALLRAIQAPVRGLRLRRRLSALAEQRQPDRRQASPPPASTKEVIPPRSLDRGSAVPLYFQLGEILKERLDPGVWLPGSRFPTEREISEEFAVSRAVIRPALDRLIADGAVLREKGRGAFVAPPKRKVALKGWTMALHLPSDFAITILSTGEESPDPAVAELLGIGDQETAITRVTAVMSVDRLPVCLAASYTDADAIPWLLPAARAVQAGADPPAFPNHDLTRTTASIENGFCGRWTASQLGLAPGDPVLIARLVQHAKVTAVGEEEPIEFTRLIYRADRAQVTIDGD